MSSRDVTHDGGRRARRWAGAGLSGAATFTSHPTDSKSDLQDVLAYVINISLKIVGLLSVSVKRSRTRAGAALSLYKHSRTNLSTSKTVCS